MTGDKRVSLAYLDHLHKTLQQVPSQAACFLLTQKKSSYAKRRYGYAQEYTIYPLFKLKFMHRYKTGDVTIFFAGFLAVLWINVHELEDKRPACDDASTTRKDVSAH